MNTLNNQRAAVNYAGYYNFLVWAQRQQRRELRFVETITVA